MYAAAVRFDLHIPQSRSLKTKRAAIRPIVDGMRHRFRVSVSEVDYHDQWQRAAIAVAVVASGDAQLREVLEAKAAGHEISIPEPVAETPVVDLMEALRASVAAASKKPGAKEKAAAPSRKKTATARK